MTETVLRISICLACSVRGAGGLAKMLLITDFFCQVLELEGGVAVV